jgi:indolepyruvate ferredoxin oxidoreductase
MSAAVSLDDKYALERGRVFLTGTQALVRLPLAQLARDRAAGHATACYISGYRGSPLGALDQQLAAARKFYGDAPIVFQPGVNEELAATAVWGSQQAGLHGEGRYAGVFAIWYGKGPGVDRSGDAFRHGNLAGSAALGGVLLLLGDDHTCESSTTSHQSEFALVDAMIPIINPSGVQEILDFGLYGWALSRYSGCWVGLKCVKDTVEVTASVEVDPARSAIRLPEDFAPPPGGLNIRWPDTPQAQEERLHEHKLDAVRAFCRANRLDRTVLDAPHARIGIATTGKSYLDVRQALDDLGIDEAAAERLGLRLYKVGMTWPLEPDGARAFAAGLETVIVVEEKRALVETQLKELLYGRDGAPRIVGKRDESGAGLFASAGALDPNRIAVEIGRRLLARSPEPGLASRVAALEAYASGPATAEAMQRTPYFCGGCPHNTSTRIPAGSRGYAGIGCSWMAQFMERNTAGFTQMGAEGLSWVGEAPFSKQRHVFQTLGDGTYFHSGLLAIRAAVAAKTNITYKILYNDAVAMTGGQPHDGPLTVPMITRQVHAEGAARVVVVTDEPAKYRRTADLAPGVTVHHRDRLDAVQRELREIEGTTVLVYDQTCAAEKRRRRKRGLYPDPPQRLAINDLVCEGCGDCGVQSNCTSIHPLETEFGRKRTIDQSSCNKDYSCAKGFCPSFVTVHGGRLRRGRPGAAEAPFPVLPEPALPALDRPYSIVVTGVGGTGVVTIGALVGMAAHLEGKGCGILDMAGLAQKGGAVWSHLRVAATPAAIRTIRVAPGGADLVLGCDVVVAAQSKTLATVRKGATRLVVNTQEVMPGEFTRKPDLDFPAARLRRAIEAAAGGDRVDFVDAGRIAVTLLGDTIAANVFMLGYAWQKGLVPVGAAALEQAIELNGAGVTMNKLAFLWGRRAAHDPAAVERVAAPRPEPGSSLRLSASLDELIERRAAFLVGYQDERYARRYLDLVDRARAAERERARGRQGLAEAVARGYFKLLAYKDEYEVARLHSDGAFAARLAGEFEGDYRLAFNLAPPLLARRDPATGVPRKIAFGPWILTAFRVLARLKRLRGTAFDPFGYTAERRTERRLIAEYETLVAEVLARLDDANHAAAVELAALPLRIRGFGHVKARALHEAKAREAELVAALRSPATAAREAA